MKEFFGGYFYRGAALLRPVFLVLALLVAASITPRSLAQESGQAASPPAAIATPPNDGFHAIQRQIETIRPGIIASTVSLRAGFSGGSGVLITPDGLVLTAAHVIAGSQGRRLNVVLSDGRGYSATFVGADTEIDLGLIQITNGKDLPAAPVGDSSTLQRGQWVLAAGHPLGPRFARPPVLRIGRVMGSGSLAAAARSNRRLATDAPLIIGDSGGPLFDLNGRVVGIHSMVTASGRMASIHSPVNYAKTAIQRARGGQTPDATSWDGPPFPFPAMIQQGQDALRANDLPVAMRSARRAVDADPTSAIARLLLAQALARNRQRDAAITALQEAIERGYNDVSAIRGDRDLAPLARDGRLTSLLARTDALNRLPGERKGDQPFRTNAAQAMPGSGRGVVRIRVDGTDVALGTIMSADGDVLTKASELPDGLLECILPDGHIASLERRGTDSDWDIALLKVDASDLEPVSPVKTVEVGHWTFTPSFANIPPVVGMIGVTEMPVYGRGIAPRPTSKAYMGVRTMRVAPEHLRALGLSQGVRVEVEENLPAAQAGMQTGDIVFEMDGKTIRDPNAFMDLLIPKRPGDSLEVSLARGDERLTITVNLTTRPAGLQRPSSLPEMLSGEVSRIAGPFDRVLHHDAMLPPSAMGGPVLDVDGRCIGINIARADRTSTYAIAASDVQAIYKRLKDAASAKK
jgi:serine protease Do